MIHIIGLDCGVTGAYCVLNIDGTPVEAACFPLYEKVVKNTRRNTTNPTRVERFYDRDSLHKLLGRFSSQSIAYLEKVNARPGESPITSFKFGDCFGQLKMVLTALGIPTIEIHPAKWCNALHDPILREEKVPAKKRSKEAFLRLFPAVAQGRRSTHPGIIDAFLIAEYGRRRINQGLDTLGAQ